MDELATKLVDSLTKVETALETMAPEAFQALVEAAHIEGILGLSGMIFLLCVTACCAKCLSVGMRWFDATTPNEYGHRKNAKAEVLIGLSSAVGGVSVVSIVLSFFSSSVVLKVINPTAYVVKTLLAQ